MNFNDEPFRNFLENLQSNKPPIYEDCGAFFYSCNSPIDAIDTSKMSTKVLDLFTFNQKVISLTKKLWKRLLHLLDHPEVYDEEHVCFSIIDTDRCSTLNKYFLSLSYSRADFKRPNINSNLHNDYLDLLKRQYVSLESFLTQTLPHLALNIENLTLKIQRSYNQVLNVTSFNSANIGGEVNRAIHNYFKRLRWTIMKFKPENIPSEVKEKKQRIDNLIDGYYRDKSNFLAIPIVGIESELNEDSHFNTSLDQNAPAALTISTTPTISKDLHVTTMSSTTSDAPTSIGIPNNKNKKAYFTTETSLISNEPSLLMKKSDILNYVKNANIANTKNYYHDSPSALSSDQFNEIVPKNENNTIILGLLFSLIGLFMFLIIFSIRRYKAKKEIQRENFWAHHVEDVECFNIN